MYALTNLLFSFWAATNGTYQCPSACFGFTTNRPHHTVEYVGLASVGFNLEHPANLDVTISVDKVVYRNALVADPSVPFLVMARDNSGRSKTITAKYNAVQFCSRTCHWHYDATGGTVK